MENDDIISWELSYRSIQEEDRLMSDDLKLFDLKEIKIMRMIGTTNPMERLQQLDTCATVGCVM
ncbi:hypothetical protein PsorP6_017977 [Peronosclerospora sorghi]|uniref:Uncharacterized protein n=1 Tax=Peronosclerospora sorghi TaxID=230839 RepID=A0ACC0WE67_9STRA|nr:hypothetical protein PsorP6_017977 [Peronosclerospora sorghi]